MPDRICSWCRGPLGPGVRIDSVFCSRKCRQTAFRFRRRRATEGAIGLPMRFAYADPPYPGLAKKYYQHEASYAGEVDHRALIASLEYFTDGWALSTSEKALRDVLPLCPKGVRVCPWVKPIGAAPATNGIHGTWEAVIVARGRQRPPGVRNWLCAQPARRGGELPGRKPIAFCAWLFDLLGMIPGDELEDLFPGSGVVGRAWREVGRSRRPEQLGDASLVDDANTSPEVLADTRRRRPPVPFAHSSR